MKLIKRPSKQNAKDYHSSNKPLVIVLIHGALIVPLALAFVWFAQLTTTSIAYNPNNVILASPSRREALILSLFVFIVTYSIFLLLFYSFVLKKKYGHLSYLK